MADFNKPTQLSTGKWIYQGTEYSSNPLAKTSTKTKEKKKTTTQKKDLISKGYKAAEEKQKKYTGGLASMLGL